MRTRRYLAAGVLTLACFAGTAAGAAPAGAADPVVASSCATVVDGVAGQEVVLDPRAVADPITGVLGRLDPLGVLVEPFRQAWNSLPPIPVGAVPAREAVISGTQIADAVVGRLREIPVVAPVLEPLIPAVHSVLSTVCGILARDDQPDAPGVGAPTSPSQPGTPGSPPSSSGGFHWSTPGSSWDSTASGSGAGFGVRLSGLLPDGTALSYGGAPGVPQPSVLGAEKDDRNAAVLTPQRSAGTAEALPAEQDQLSQPVLLAVLLLTLVSAQLVRTWVLRTRL